MKKVTVAAVQASPVYLELAPSLQKLEGLARTAAATGAQLICFGETWLPGYPAWLDFCPGAASWGSREVKEVFARLYANSLLIPGVETEKLCRLASELSVTIVVGVNERVEAGPGNGTLYNSLLTFTPDGRLANHHRKLVPTFSERMVWGQGDARGLRTVPTPQARVGGLICWEHWMPLARQAMHNAGEDIHIAVWPTVHDLHQLASRHYAFEGRCFVIAVGLLMPASDLPLPYDPAKIHSSGSVERGGTAIFGPDGACLAGPVFDTETILTAELDLARIAEERMTLDVTGHYSRPDVFEFGLREKTGK